MERFALPDSLGGLSDEAINELEGKANERLAALRSVEHPTGDDVAELAAIKASRPALKAERASRAEFASTLADLDAPEPTPEPVPEPVVIAAPAPVPAPAPPAPVVAASEPVEPPEPAPVVAKAPVPSTAVPEAPASPRLVITAAADIPQVQMGSSLDMGGLANAVYQKARVIGNSKQKFPIATMEKQFRDGFDLTQMNQSDAWQAINDLASVKNYETLLAAGGWCAPSEILYDLYESVCPRPALFSLPTFRANRGGVRWPTFAPIDFTDVVDWIWTEADDIAAVTGQPTKPCIRVDCPEFEECRLDAHGVCVIVGNLIDRAYPEQVRWFLNRVFFLHDRAESLFKINAVIADADAVTVGATFAAGSAVVAALLLEVQAYRDRNGHCCDSLVEAWAPCWLKEAIRADIARQDFGGVGNSGLVSDATIRAWFASFGVSINFLSFWQALEDPVPGNTLTWPATVQILFNTPGSYVQFDGGTLDLGITRDSVLNAVNDYNIFTEDFYCIGRRGPRGVLVTVPICPLGTVGGRNVNADDTAACPAA